METPSTEQIIAGSLVRDAIKFGIELCKKPITGTQLDKQIEEFIKDNSGVPVLKGYKPPFTDKTYQHTICLSRNNEAVHGVPNELNVAEDLITIDLVVGYKGWHADSARTFTYSSDLAKKAMVEKIQAVHNNSLSVIFPNASLNYYADYCQRIAAICRVGIVKEFCGHGIGRGIHEDPQVPCVPTFSHETFEVGRAYAIEPVIAAKHNYQLNEGDDGWVVRADCLTAHMEDTIFITSKGMINLTN